MKHVVSVSLGSTLRNKTITVKIANEEIVIERIGTGGDLKKAGVIISRLDGKVDAFGLGGCDLGMTVNQKYYPLHSIKKIAGFAQKTPLTDGGGIKNTLEKKIVFYLERELGDSYHLLEKRVLLVNAVSRWGMAQSFIDAGFDCVYGDFMFSLGIPLPVKTKKGILLAVSALLPVVTRLPFQWIYPVGTGEEKHHPKYERFYSEASVIAGDCLYIRQHLPANLGGKIIVTNTTTEDDIETFRKCGIKYVLTTTPVFDGRTFGTNMLEAIIIALSGKKTILSESELYEWIHQLKIEPQIRKLN
jgi:hypothetical protein